MKTMNKLPRVTTLLAALALASVATATEAPLFFTYQGRILKANGVDPVEDPSVTFKVQIRSPDGQCLLYEETQTIDMTDSSGVFSFNVGLGQNTNATALNMKQIIENKTTKAGANGCSYVPASGDPRKLRLSWTNGSETAALPSDQIVASVPYALNSTMLGGLTKEKFMLASSPQSQADLDLILQQTTNIMNLVNGSTNVYLKASDINIANGVIDMSNGGVKVPDSPSAPTNAVNKNYVDARVGGINLNVTNITNGQSLVYNSTNNQWETHAFTGDLIKTGTISGNTSINVSGAIDTTNNVTVGGTVTSTNITSVNASHQNVKIYDVNNSKKVTMSIPSSLTADYSLIWPLTAGNPGQVLATDGSGNLSWIAPGAVTQVQANAPLSVGGTSNAPILSVAQATTSAWGVVQLATDGQSAANFVVQGNDSRLSNSRVPTGTAGGDLSGSYPNPTVTKINGVPFSNLTPTTGSFFRYSGSQWVATQINIGDLRSTGGSGLFANATCGAGQSMSYSSISDSFVCNNITINANNVTGLGNSVTLNVGTGANTVAAGDDSRFGNAFKLYGRNVASTAPAANQFLSWNNVTNVWEPTLVDWSKISSLPTTITGYGITDAIRGNGTIVMIRSGNDSARPTAGNAGVIYVAIDTQKIYRDNGSTWDTVVQSSNNSGTVTSVTAGVGLNVGSGPNGTITTTGTLNVDVGTSAGKIVQVDSNGKLPALDGSQLSNLPIPFKNIQYFDATNTFTVPTGVSRIFVQVWGAGGGGGGGSSALGIGGGSGGGGGGFVQNFINVTPGQTIAVTIGAGGAKGTAGAPGTTGGTTSFGSSISMTGGAGGQVGGTTSVLGGVTAVLGNQLGGRGGPILGSTGGPGGVAAGGGGQGGFGSPTSGNPGDDGIAPGGGGGGGYGVLTSASSGGNGAAGRIIVFY